MHHFDAPTECKKTPDSCQHAPKTLELRAVALFWRTSGKLARQLL